MQFISPHLPNIAILLPKLNTFYRWRNKEKFKENKNSGSTKLLWGPDIWNMENIPIIYITFIDIYYKLLLNIMKSTVSTKDDFFLTA